MGFTHYFPARRPVFEAEWAALTNATRILLAHLPEYSTSAGGYYDDVPIRVLR